MPTDFTRRAKPKVKTTVTTDTDSSEDKANAAKTPKATTTSSDGKVSSSTTTKKQQQQKQSKKDQEKFNTNKRQRKSTEAQDKYKDNKHTRTPRTSTRTAGSEDESIEEYDDEGVIPVPPKHPVKMLDTILTHRVKADTGKFEYLMKWKAIY